MGKDINSVEVLETLEIHFLTHMCQRSVKILRWPVIPIKVFSRAMVPLQLLEISC